jgi:hypothetical protein
MVRIPLLVVSTALAASLAGCAGGINAGPVDATSASPTSDVPAMRAMAGHWQGSLWESHAPPIYKQGSAAMDLTIAPDGTWAGTIGPDRASGTARWHGKRLLLTGTLRRASGPDEPVYLDLTGNDTQRWSETPWLFGDRLSPASASLKRVL